MIARRTSLLLIAAGLALAPVALAPHHARAGATRLLGRALRATPRSDPRGARALAPWAGRAEVEVTPLTAPARGWLVRFETDDMRVSALIQDYAGARAGELWAQSPRGECYDESEAPPQLAELRSYAGRQAQIRIDGARPGPPVRLARTRRPMPRSAVRSEAALPTAFAARRARDHG